MGRGRNRKKNGSDAAKREKNSGENPTSSDLGEKKLSGEEINAANARTEDAAAAGACQVRVSPIIPTGQENLDGNLASSDLGEKKPSGEEVNAADARNVVTPPPISQATPTTPTRAQTPNETQLPKNPSPVADANSTPANAETAAGPALPATLTTPPASAQRREKVYSNGCCSLLLFKARTKTDSTKKTGFNP